MLHWEGVFWDLNVFGGQKFLSNNFLLFFVGQQFLLKNFLRRHINFLYLLYFFHHGTDVLINVLILFLSESHKFVSLFIHINFWHVQIILRDNQILINLLLHNLNLLQAIVHLIPDIFLEFLLLSFKVS